MENKNTNFAPDMGERMAERLSARRKRRRGLFIATTIILAIAITLSAIGTVLFYLIRGDLISEYEENRVYYPENFEVSVVRKNLMDYDFIHYKFDTYKPTFTVEIKNCGKFVTKKIEGIFTFKNGEGKTLYSDSWYFEGELLPGDVATCQMYMELDFDYTAQEFYYSQLTELCATFDVKKIVYEDEGEFTFNKEPLVVLELADGAGQVSTVEYSYRRAIRYYNDGMYEEASMYFANMRGYKDAEKYYKDCMAKLQ